MSAAAAGFQYFFQGASTLPGLLLAILYLAGVNQYLTFYNLFDPYYNLVQQQYPQTANCTSDDVWYRSADGHCNDFNITAMGSSSTRFGRVTYYPQAAVVSDAHNSSIFLQPNPLLVAELLSRKNDNDFIASPNLNMLAAAWIQFNVHDWFNHIQDTQAPQISVPDPKLPRRTSFSLHRTARDSSGFALNDNTHWWDASQLYGSTKAQQRKVRTYEGGHLVVAIDPATRLPITGFSQNWWLGLSIMHHTFISEHNYLADQLALQNPTWTDEQLFQHTRLLIAAIIAKVHTLEWTFALLQNAPAQGGLDIDWYGVAFFNLTVPELLSFGLTPQQIQAFAHYQGVGHTRDITKPQWMPEEFVTVYRMHPLLPDTLKAKIVDVSQARETCESEFPLSDVLFSNAEHVLNEVGLSNWIAGFGLNPAGHLKFGNYPFSLSNLRLPSFQGGGTLNLAAVDILRDRERLGIRYNEFRRQLALPPLTAWSQLALDNDTTVALSNIYGGDLEKLDILPGLLAEANWPAGFGVSTTTFWIFTFITPRRLSTDRFFQESFNVQTYTQFGMNYISTTYFKDILVRHNPSLANILGQVANPFSPWNQTGTIRN